METAETYTLRLVNSINGREPEYMRYIQTNARHDNRDMLKIYHVEDGKRVIDAWVDKETGLLYVPGRKQSLDRVDNKVEYLFDFDEGVFFKPAIQRTKQTARKTVQGRAPRISGASKKKIVVKPSYSLSESSDD